MWWQVFSQKKMWSNVVVGVVAAVVLLSASSVDAIKCMTMTSNGANAGTCYIYLYAGETVRDG